jgi:hypothetical protein
VRVGLVVGMFVVTAMGCHPPRRAALQAADPEQGKNALQPFRADEALVGQQPVVADIDAQHAEDINAQHGKSDARPTEKPRHECEQGQRMVEREPGDLGALQTHATRNARERVKHGDLQVGGCRTRPVHMHFPRQAFSATAVGRVVRRCPIVWNTRARWSFVDRSYAPT